MCFWILAALASSLLSPAQYAEAVGILLRRSGKTQVAAAENDHNQHPSSSSSSASSSSSSLLQEPPSPPRCINLHEQEATQRPRNFRNFDHGSRYEGLYVNPEANFAFCTIEKNACSSWAAIISKLESHNVSNNDVVWGITQDTFTVAKANEVFQNPSSTRAVFVRDPLERFLSAFLDKCFSIGCKNIYCGMRSQEQTKAGQQITFSQAVSWLLKKDLSELDGHYKPQAKHCELERRVKEYNVIGHMESSNLASTASCLLEHAGLERLNVISSKAGSEPFWQQKEGEQTVDYLMKFYTPKSAKAVYDAFAIDYQTFDLPRPAWMDHATGELYASTSGTKCSEEASFSDSQTGDSAWDIPTLARRAGFKI
mmetsp:Transcript_43695/g.76631  ORF Transcript_43695/g.76631 Transcript_43695/m.76631 type:complete len:369 (+) Transcript_43695:95-1201(+)